MATTVNNAFAVFKSRLEVTPLQAQTLSRRHVDVRGCVGKAFTIVDDFLIGSYVRDTACRPIKDVDIMVVLHWGKYGEYYKNQRGPYALLSAVKEVLVDAYKTTRIRVDGQAVSMYFSDFTVDVVPAFGIIDNGKWVDWWIPDSPGDTWIRTNPKNHQQIMTEANRRCNNMFKPMVKMIKAWNRNNGNILKGFHIEVMADRIFTSAPTSYAHGMLQFFDSSWYLLRDGVNDPTNTYDRVDTYLTDNQRSLAQSKVYNAEQRAREAITAEQVGNAYSAVTTWRSIVGDPFPSWG
ncbi:CBASS oligonucleotide cyclase [Pelotomaculum propionicicum]|uniref:Nucleotidyltransferase n=1 Tax=Pelotomaculum propionicicum TaxID=258475 RepID=A0A4Y7RJB9_9FIRM|nr:CBASS oligonucleotide cyclase [Pelotomaculum propionicicum]TEB09084.1 hypothetical protein Pmgp_03401 [Pelotomaculum propionicicum]